MGTVGQLIVGRSQLFPVMVGTVWECFVLMYFGEKGFIFQLNTFYCMVL